MIEKQVSKDLISGNSAQLREGKLDHHDGLTWESAEKKKILRARKPLMLKPLPLKEEEDLINYVRNVKLIEVRSRTK